MAPLTSEKELEKKIESREKDLQLIRLKIAGLRKEIFSIEEDLIQENLEISRLKEGLRKFREMYPDLCRLKE